MIYKCTVCGHIHNEEETGILLKNLDKCPVCGQPISKFAEAENIPSEKQAILKDADMA